MGRENERKGTLGRNVLELAYLQPFLLEPSNDFLVMDERGKRIGLSASLEGPPCLFEGEPHPEAEAAFLDDRDFHHPIIDFPQ